MNEAKNLPVEPSVQEPALFDAVAVSAHAEAIPPQVASGPATKLNDPTSLGRRFTTHLLIFFLIGICTFGIGASVAGALVTGLLDSHTAHLKELMHQMKDLVHISHGQ